MTILTDKIQMRYKKNIPTKVSDFISINIVDTPITKVPRVL